MPGVTATYLRDLYPLRLETIWEVIRKNYHRVQLRPDTICAEARQPATGVSGDDWNPPVHPLRAK